MICYFDTSALVPLLVDEPTTGEARRLWHDSDRVASARIAVVETAAALAQAARGGRLSQAQHSEVRRAASYLFDRTDLVEIDAPLVHSAARLAEQHALRGYDAVHLAAAMTMHDRHLVFVAGDQALLRAARSAGLATAALEN